MLIQELVVVATLLIVGGAIISIAWRIMTSGGADKKLDALVQEAKAANPDETPKKKKK